MSNNNRLPSQIFCDNDHKFHIECIKKLKTDSCPLCREKIHPVIYHGLRISKNRIESHMKQNFSHIKGEKEIYNHIVGLIKEYDAEEDYERRFLIMVKVYSLFCHFNEVICGKIYDWSLKLLLDNLSIIIKTYDNSITYDYAVKIRDELREMHTFQEDYVY